MVPYENHLKKQGYKIIAGCDEAGRGPWAGPVIAAACILPQRVRCKFKLRDSKRLTPKRREEIFDYLIKKTIYGIGITERRDIDRLGLIKATNLAFKKAINNLPIKPDYLLIDGRDKFKFNISFKSIIKGDLKIRSVAAASIIAKVVRDRIMQNYARKYQNYGFEFHKGYGTVRHRQALQKYGICSLHRRSYRPIKEILNKS